MTVVLLDPGHGGPKSDGVTVGSFREDDWALEVAGRVTELLDQAFETHLTRLSDRALTFAQRRAIEQSIDPQLVVCVHVNSNPDPSLNGAQAYYWPGSPIGRAMADTFMRALPPTLRGSVQGVVMADEEKDTPPERRWKQRAHKVLSTYKAPALLCECGMASNTWDLEYIQTQDGKHAIACAIEAAVVSGAAALKRVD